MDCQVKELTEAIKSLAIPAGVKTLVFYDPEAVQTESIESIPEDFFKDLDCYFVPVDLRGRKIQDCIMAVKRENVVAEPLVSPTS